MKTISDDPKKGIKLDFRTTEDQQYFDAWENRIVTVRYAGICIACHRRKVYQPLSKDGHPYDPDPRGIFGQQIGCECHPFAWWEGKAAAALAKANKFTKAEIKEYRAYIKLFKAVGK